MITVVDIETTMDFETMSSSPFFGQQLVFVGYRTFDTEHTSITTRGVFFYHNQREPSDGCRGVIQDVLDSTKCLIGHNIKFDLEWLRECGFTYQGKLFDTMVMEYLLARGIKRPLSLADCAHSRNLPEKRTDLTSGYIKNKISYEDMPPEIVEEYCLADVDTTYQLAKSQLIDANMTWDSIQ